MEPDELVSDIFASLLLQLMKDGEEHSVEIETEFSREKFYLYKIDGELKILQNKDTGYC